MKKISLYTIAALFCMVSCDKQEINGSLQNGQEDKYELALNTVRTRSGIDEVNLMMGEDEQYTLVATLLKNGEPVSGATYSWSDPETGKYYTGSTDGKNTEKHTVTAIKEGSGGTLCVTGYEGDKARATSQDIEVIVSAAALTIVSISLDGPTVFGYNGEGEYTITAEMSDGTYQSIAANAPGVSISVNSGDFSTRKGNTFEMFEDGDITGSKIHHGDTFTVTVSYEGLSDSVSGSIRYAVAGVSAEIKGSWSNSDSAGADWYEFADEGSCSTSGSNLSLLAWLNLFPYSNQTYLRFDYIAVSYNVYSGNDGDTENIEYYTVSGYSDGMTMTGDRRYRICSFDKFGFKTNIFMGMQ